MGLDDASARSLRSQRNPKVEMKELKLGDTIETIATNLKWGLKYGLTIALVFTMIAAVSLVLVGEQAFDERGTSFLELIEFYALGGCVGGAILGLLRPLAATKLGTVFIGMCIGFCVWGGFLAQHIGLRNLEPFDYFTLAFAALIGGPFGASFFLRDQKSETSSTNKREGKEGRKK